MTETENQTVTEREFPAFCRAHGLKCTAQRLAVFAVVCKRACHSDVDGTWAAVRKTVPTITRESVYRILNEFADLGILVRLDALAAARYDTDVGPHAHFICEACGVISDYPMPSGFALPSDMPPERHHLELRVTGLCPRCAKKGQKTKSKGKRK